MINYIFKCNQGMAKSKALAINTPSLRLLFQPPGFQFQIPGPKLTKVGHYGDRLVYVSAPVDYNVALLEVTRVFLYNEAGVTLPVMPEIMYAEPDRAIALGVLLHTVQDSTSSGAILTFILPIIGD